MLCETCGSKMSCVDTRHSERNNNTRRRYICACGARLTTLEIPAVINPNNKRELFPRDLSRYFPALAHQWDEGAKIAENLVSFLRRFK